MDLEQRLRDAVEPRYRIEKELGRGGMAVVFEAVDTKHGRTVAIKALSGDHASGDAAQRFAQEIAVATNLQHPNILPIHDSGTVEGLLYYVMPLVEGGSLRDRLEQEGQLPVEEAVSIAAEISDGLDHAHKEGVVHRDIKPENILFSSGRPVLSDFGIARMEQTDPTSRLTRSGVAIGTVTYMSPEQGRGDDRLDGRSDIYSLACVLYEMIAGEPPFIGATEQAVLIKHQNETATPLQILRSNTPTNVREAVEKALSKSPADRFVSAGDFRRKILEATGDRQEKTAWPRLALGFLTVLVLAVVGNRVPEWWESFWGRTLDANKIVVFPLVDQARGEAGSERGFDVALAIEAGLEHAYPLKFIDGRQRLPPAIREDPSLLSAESARDIARERRSAFYLDGVISESNDTMTVVLWLHDVDGDSVLVQESASGETGAYPATKLGLLAISEILPQIIDPGREVDLSILIDRGIGAQALWIQGEKAYRRSDFDAALDYYRRAVEEDSLLAFAAIKGAQAASWSKRLDEALEMAGIAVTGDSLLPQQYAFLARGLQGYLTGDADTALAWLERAESVAPEWPEPRMAIGEVLYHLLPTSYSTGSSAESSFSSALELDSAFSPPRMHLAEISARRGDLAQVRSLTDDLNATGADSPIVRHLSLIQSCIQEDAEAFAWPVNSVEEVGETVVAAKTLAAAASEVACGENGFRAVLSSPHARRADRWGALLGLHGPLLAQGRTSEALNLLTETVSSGDRSALVLFLFDDQMGIDTRGEAEGAQRFAAEATGERYAGASPEWLWLLGIRHARLGDFQTAEGIATDLASSPESRDQHKRQVLGEALSAHLAAAQGDTALAIQLLDRLENPVHMDDLVWRIAEPLPLERLLKAKLLFARERYQEAMEEAAVFDHPGPIMFLGLIPPSLGIRLESARRLGMRELEEEFAARLTELGWETPSGSAQPWCVRQKIAHNLPPPSGL